MRFISLPSMKVVTVVGTAAATLIAGVVAASASGMPDSFGQQVKAQVAACKASGPRTGNSGIGQCVSSWVRLHNPATMARDSNEPTEATEPRELETETGSGGSPTHSSTGGGSHRPAGTFGRSGTSHQSGHSGSGHAPATTGHDD